MEKIIALFKIVMFPLLMVLLMWIVFLFEIDYGYNLNEYGIYPRRLLGLVGVFFAPFIHGNFEHLTNNTISFFVLTLTLRYFYPKNYMRIFVMGLLLTGLLTWVIGRGAYHIGMSGQIYFLASFIFTKSFFSKNYRLIALSLTIIFLYGGMIWYVLPIDKAISWEGHLSGVLMGIALSFLYENEILDNAVEEKVVSYEQSLFLDHFNEKGRFVANLPFLDEEGNLILEEEE